MPLADHRNLNRPAIAVAAVLCAVGLSACGGGGLSGLFESKKAPAPAAAAVETPPLPPRARASGSSSIAVLVNEDPITNYDITQRKRLMQLGGAKPTDKAATDELIDETLQMYEGRKRGLGVPEAQVNDAFASIGENLKLSPDQLSKALSSQGVEAASLKKRLRAQITWQYLVQRRTQQKAQIKTEDITSALLAKGNPSDLTLTEFVLQQIVFVVPKGSPAALYTQRRREATAFRDRFKGCESSLEQAKLLNGVVVRTIGRRDATQLGGDQGQQIQKTPVGKTAPPSQTELGIELVAVCSTRAIQSTAAARAEVQNSFYLKQSKELGKEYMDELRKAAIIEYR